ncbi:copper homeostasis protein cutC homolog isoform X2 [Gigantopelta aegis]|uniref:copper homeostasis protein cutC homolog isoform X2 n=1 Tax=Gigantopelta aegis TaxID=1735272 RepID=UPI001B88DEA5|nr:copper homeostasis protein cutC homolog isoform X2 [Gigantopelta aegis]
MDINTGQLATNARAKRLELCSNLLEGGTTPSIGMLLVIKRYVTIPVFVMIRPRGGDFCYSDTELQIMKEDIVSLKKAGADGFVFGVLSDDGSVNADTTSALLSVVRPLPATFHRAIDMTSDIHKSLQTIIDMGFERVLTTGGESSALEGAPVIKEMVEMAADRIVVMPGGGIHERNLDRILKITGAKEFHGSAHSSQPSKMKFRKQGVTMGSKLSPPEYDFKVTNPNRVSCLVALASNIWETD